MVHRGSAHQLRGGTAGSERHARSLSPVHAVMDGQKSIQQTNDVTTGQNFSVSGTYTTPPQPQPISAWAVHRSGAGSNKLFPTFSCNFSSESLEVTT